MRSTILARHRQANRLDHGPVGGAAIGGYVEVWFAWNASFYLVAVAGPVVLLAIGALATLIGGHLRDEPQLPMMMTMLCSALAACVALAAAWQAEPGGHARTEQGGR